MPNKLPESHERHVFGRAYFSIPLCYKSRMYNAVRSMTKGKALGADRAFADSFRIKLDLIADVQFNLWTLCDSLTTTFLTDSFGSIVLDFPVVRIIS